MNKIAFLAISAYLSFAACNGSNDGEPKVPDNGPPPPNIPYTIVNTFPHDTGFFTEGLEFHGGQLFESSGSGAANAGDTGYYPSAFGIADLKTGKVSIKGQLDKSKFFGEGITFFKNKMYQLTWKNKIGYIYDANTFKKIGEFPIPAKEGWSFTHDSSHLIMSDGTSNLYIMDPDSLHVLNMITVTDNNGPVSNVNELEYVNGFIYANQWLTSYILKIDANNGKVVGRLDLANLEKEIQSKNPELDQMNGIAYNSSSNTFYVTGKLWPTIYEIKIE